MAMNLISVSVPRALAACLLLLTAACAEMDSGDSWAKWKSEGAKPNGPALAAPDTVTLRLAEAAEKAATSLDNISRVEQVRTPLPGGSEADDMAGAPPELMEPVSIAWTGPLERFMSAMANRVGYSFRTSGSPPPVTVTVQVNAYNEPVIRVIRSAALQVTGKADVVVDASRQLVEVRYAPVDSTPQF